MSDLVAGQPVYHAKWGEGVILSFKEGKAYVWFSREGYHWCNLSELQAIEQRQGD